MDPVGPKTCGSWTLLERAQSWSWPEVQGRNEVEDLLVGQGVGEELAHLQVGVGEGGPGGAGRRQNKTRQRGISVLAACGAQQQLLLRILQEGFELAAQIHQEGVIFKSVL